MVIGSTEFAFVIPTRNAYKTLRQALGSVAFQSYDKWRCVIVDDDSDEQSKEHLYDVCKQLCITDKVTIIENTERKWEMANIIEALKHVKPHEVVCRLDLDDYLCDLNSLEILAQLYDDNPDIEAAWSSHRWYDENGVTKNNISGPMPNGMDVYRWPWCASHFKTFRKHIYDGINQENFKGEDGEFIKRTGDQALYLPILHKAKRYLHVPIQMYAYYCQMKPETFQTDDAKFQKSEAEFIRERGFVE